MITKGTHVMRSFHTALIDIGWDAPAGQMYSSANDLAQLLKLIFRPELPYNVNTGQVYIYISMSCIYLAMHTPSNTLSIVLLRREGNYHCRQAVLMQEMASLQD